MSLDTPTTAELSANIIAQLEATLNQTIPLLPSAFNRVLAKVFGGVFIILYKYGGAIFLNLFVQTASDKDTTILGVTINPLTFWGRLIGLGDRIAATTAELLIDVTVTNQTGSLPSGSQLVNADNGFTYITIGAVLLDAAVVSPTIRAVSDQAGGGGVGTSGNLDPGDVVSFANALPNVTRDAIVDSQIVTAADAETSDVYRQKIEDRFQLPPQGGAYVDYVIWGLEVAGIVNIYPFTSDNPGQVDVFVEATVASSGNADGIPTAAQLLAVLDSIFLDDNNLNSRRPAGALVNTFAITRKGFDVTVSGLVVDNLADVQQQIDDSVVQFFLDADQFIDGLTIPPRQDRITRTALIGLVDDIVSADNGTFTTLLFFETGSAVSINIYVLQNGEKSKLETSVTFE